MDRAIRFGRYCLHPKQGLTRGKTEVRVTRKALAVLSALAARPGQIVTKEELFRTVWPDTAVSDAALSSCILELRHALHDDARCPRYIETVHRTGFRFLARPATDLGDALQPSLSHWPSAPSGPFVGRDSVLLQLSRALQRAHDGVRQVVFVTGEAGIGKTSLLDAFVARIADRESWRICRADCVEHYGAGEAYRALFDALARLGRQPGGESVVEALRRYAPSWLAQLPALQTPAEVRALQRRTSGVTPERMLRELNDAFEAMTLRTRIVLCLEDLHWSDVATLDWIVSFARRPERAGVLLLATYRHEEGASTARSPQVIADELGIKCLCAEIALTPLDRQSVTEYALTRFPAMPGADASLRRLASSVHRHTEGNPLFVVNVFNDLLARGILASHELGWVAPEDVDAGSLGIPVDVRRTIEHQFDRLNEAERGLLEVASIAGSSFAAAAVAAAAEAPVDTVEETLGALARRSAFLREAGAATWPDGTVSTAFHFLHALYREVVAGRLSAGRRVALHRLIGTRLEIAYGERAPQIAAELALHFEQAHDTQRAVVYFQRAGEADRGRSAHVAAQKHFHRALTLLENLPAAAERDAREVLLRIDLGGELMATRGFGAPEVADCYARARDLCRRVETTPHLFSALWGLWLFYASRGPLGTARELADRLLDLAQQSGDPALLLQAHHAQWGTALGTGDLRAVQAHVSAGMEHFEPERDVALATTYGNHDAAACGGFMCAWADALAGRTATAARGLDAAIARARDVAHPFTLALTLVGAAGAFCLSRNAGAARQLASEGGALAQEHSFGLMRAWASIYEGRALFELGERNRGLSLMRDGVAAARATGSSIFQSLQLALLAEAELRHDLYDDAANSLDEAFALSERIGERLSASELHRVRGELCLARSDEPGSRRRAEDDFRAAIEIARAQGATLFALRAAVSLARLLAATTRSAEGLALVAAALDEITEGRDLPDITEATGLLGGAMPGATGLFPAPPTFK
jgi:DNA-binding winged helix-turn-helix (wHTH) protein